jgi:hypothetical protein
MEVGKSAPGAGTAGTVHEAPDLINTGGDDGCDSGQSAEIGECAVILKDAQAGIVESRAFRRKAMVNAWLTLRF